MAAEWGAHCGWARWKEESWVLTPSKPHESAALPSPGPQSPPSRIGWGLLWRFSRTRSGIRERPPAAGGAFSMTRRSAGQAPARRPLDWSGRGGPELRRPAPLRSRERKLRAVPGWAGGPGHRQVRAEAGRRRAAGRVEDCRWAVSPLSVSPASLRTRGPGPPAGSAPLGARGARRPALPPSELHPGPWGVRAPDGPEPPRAPQGLTGLELPGFSGPWHPCRGSPSPRRTGTRSGVPAA